MLEESKREQGTTNQLKFPLWVEGCRDYRCPKCNGVFPASHKPTWVKGQYLCYLCAHDSIVESSKWI